MQNATRIGDARRAAGRAAAAATPVLDRTASGDKWTTSPSSGNPANVAQGLYRLQRRCARGTARGTVAVVLQSGLRRLVQRDLGDEQVPTSGLIQHLRVEQHDFPIGARFSKCVVVVVVI